MIGNKSGPGGTGIPTRTWPQHREIGIGVLAYDKDSPQATPAVQQIAENGPRIYDPARVEHARRVHQHWKRHRKALRAALFARDGRACRECGSEDDPTADHIVPVYEFGTNELSNLQVLCRSCNSRKGRRI